MTITVQTCLSAQPILRVKTWSSCNNLLKEQMYKIMSWTTCGILDNSKTRKSTYSQHYFCCSHWPFSNSLTFHWLLGKSNFSLTSHKIHWLFTDFEKTFFHWLFTDHWLPWVIKRMGLDRTYTHPGVNGYEGSVNHKSWSCHLKVPVN